MMSFLGAMDESIAPILLGKISYNLIFKDFTNSFVFNYLNVLYNGCVLGEL